MWNSVVDCWRERVAKWMEMHIRPYRLCVLLPVCGCWYVRVVGWSLAGLGRMSARCD